MVRNRYLDWARQPPPNLARLSRFSIGNDRYDREDFERLMEEMREFRQYRDKLADSKVDDLAYDVWQDLFLSLFKVDPRLLDPEEMRPTNLVSRRVMEEMHDLTTHKELRTYTAGDDVGAALASNHMEPDLETLFDKLENEMRMAKELQELMEQLLAAQNEQRDLDDMIRDWTEEHPDEPKDFSEEQQELQDKVDELMQQVDESGSSLEELLQQATPQIRAALRMGLDAASGQAQNMDDLAAMWGTEPGELVRMPAEQRIALARRTNTPKFRRVAELFGPMKRFAFSEQRRRVNHSHEEAFDVELGADLSRLLPTELLMLDGAERELLFLRLYYERQLLQYAMRGHERVAKGGIIYVHDGSGTMEGEREIWAKALGLTLLHIARKQKREFVAIQFGSASEIMVHDFRDGEITPDRVLDFAEFFFNGGTDFEAPLNVALKLLDEENERTGALRSDIVFVTDGICQVAPDWMRRWENERERLGFKCWGVNLSGARTMEPMSSICAGSVATVRSLMNGESVREIFGNV